MLTTPLCLVCWQIWRPSVDWEIFHHRKTKQNRPKIQLWWMISEAEEGQNTARAMWEESERGLLFARIKPKHFLYWHTLNVLEPSSRTFPQGEPLLWTPGFSRQSDLRARPLCGHPTSLGSAHTELTDCPWTKSMKHSWVTRQCGSFPVLSSTSLLWNLFFLDLWRLVHTKPPLLSFYRHIFSHHFITICFPIK